MENNNIENENVDIGEQPASPVSTVLLTPTTPEPDEDNEPPSNIIQEENITSRSNIREWKNFNKELVKNNSSVLDNHVLTSKYKTRMIKTLKQYPYTIQYRIIKYILQPDHPPIYSRHSRWPEEDVREHSYWVTCEILDLIARTPDTQIIPEQINCALAIIRSGPMTGEDIAMIKPHFTSCLYRIRSTGYLWCKTLIAFMLGIHRSLWEGPLRNHIRNNITDYDMVGFLRAIHTNHALTITDDKCITMLFKWLGFGKNIDGEDVEDIPPAFTMAI